MGLKGTCQQNACFDDIGPFVQEIRVRFPTMGAQQVITLLRQDYSMKVSEYVSVPRLLAKSDIFYDFCVGNCFLNSFVKQSLKLSLCSSSADFGAGAIGLLASWNTCPLTSMTNGSALAFGFTSLQTHTQAVFLGWTSGGVTETHAFSTATIFVLVAKLVVRSFY